MTTDTLPRPIEGSNHKDRGGNEYRVVLIANAGLTHVPEVVLFIDIKTDAWLALPVSQFWNLVTT